MTRETLSESPLTGPLELVKDQSILKARVFAVALAVGHPFYYWVWTRLDPQPYESLAWRLVAAALAAATVLVLFRLGANDRRAVALFGVATAFGTVVHAAWFYVANGGNAVWLASLVLSIVLYFSFTDWRIATLVTLLSMAGGLLAIPLGVGVWAAGRAASYPVYDLTAGLILALALGASILTRYTDMSMRVVRMRSKLRALEVSAHEVRTPVAGIDLLAHAAIERLEDLALRPGGHTAETKEALVLLQGIARGCSSINALLATQLANATPNRCFKAHELVDVGAAATQAVDLFDGARPSGPSMVTLDVRQSFAIPSADRQVLIQILLNLLDNARKSLMRRHQAVAPGQISLFVDYDSVGRITIADSGEGIPSINLNRIFDPFYTGAQEHGHGLGLTFVKEAVRAYDGTLKLTSTVGKGTEITIEFNKAQAR